MGMGSGPDLGGGVELVQAVSPSLGLIKGVGGSVDLFALLVGAEDVGGNHHLGIIGNLEPSRVPGNTTC